MRQLMVHVFLPFILSRRQGTVLIATWFLHRPLLSYTIKLDRTLYCSRRARVIASADFASLMWRADKLTWISTA
ncbi:hypothetical protein EV363DRAFT_812408 [Boletus edulis]|nr:hypothetical protein EV363DRAFT_812408 [Boletus edulis]